MKAHSIMKKKIDNQNNFSDEAYKLTSFERSGLKHSSEQIAISIQICCLFIFLFQLFDQLQRDLIHFCAHFVDEIFQFVLSLKLNQLNKNTQFQLRFWPIT